MNLFLAAVYTNKYMDGQRRYQNLTPHEQSIMNALPNILESYHYVGKQSYVDEMRADNAKIFLDSGAFSAKSLGVDINIDEYCDYINRNRDILRVEDGIEMASVLDGIGDPLQTWRNQLYMEAKGVRPLPCFHYGEDERYLEWYLERYEYITIGGLVRTKAEDVMKWLDRIWNKYLLDGSGRPRVKTHAFGVTTTSLMERYPWHSVDSSSWIQAAAFGSIFTSEHGPIAVSEKSPNRHCINQHFSTMSEIHQEYLIKLIGKRGFTYERLSTIYEARAAYNCLGYYELGNDINARTANKRSAVLDMQQLF